MKRREIPLNVHAMQLSIPKFNALLTTGRSGTARNRPSAEQQVIKKRFYVRDHLVCVFRILQNLQLLNGFFSHLSVFRKKALQTSDQLFLFCLIV